MKNNKPNKALLTTREEYAIKPPEYSRKNDPETVKRLKVAFIEYYRKLPIQKYARQWIARDEDTISRWKKEDKEFADQIDMANSAWTQENASMVKNREFLLERIQHQDFMEHKQQDNGVTDELSKAMDRLAEVLKPQTK